ncbi:MAG: DMT family transporter [Pseudomonadota bacterium]
MTSTSSPAGTAGTQNTRLGILLMIATTMVFSLQDALSRHLGAEYNVLMVVMIRFWFFGAFALWFVLRRPGGLRKAAATGMPWLQILRGLLLAGEVCVMVVAFVRLGLVETHAVFICYPLIVAALAGPILGEHVGWRRYGAIAVGFVGVLVVLRPGAGIFDPQAGLPFLAASMFALYALLTRYVARTDSATTSFFWAGLVGALAMTVVGIWQWEPLAPRDWVWMVALCISAAIGHWLLIRCYEVAEASAVQPFAYLQLVWVSILGVTLFGERVTLPVVIGAGLVIAAGLFTWWRERRAAA